MRPRPRTSPRPRSPFAPLYNQYANDVLMPAMDSAVLAQIKQFEADGTTDDPRYEQLLMEHHYALHVCRLPIEEWPDPIQRALAHINPSIYVPMQGPSDLADPMHYFPGLIDFLNAL